MLPSLFLCTANTQTQYRLACMHQPVRHCQIEMFLLPPQLPCQIICVSCSGSGKSTLLDILAQRKTVGKLKGQVLIAGHPPTQTFLRRYAGYVEQFDTLIPVLTVHEMLLYTAELKTSRSVPLQVCMFKLLVTSPWMMLCFRLCHKLAAGSCQRI